MAEGKLLPDVWPNRWQFLKLKKATKCIIEARKYGQLSNEKLVYVS